MKMTKNITEGNIYKNLLLYAIPLILSSLLLHAYNTVDAIIAGKCVGEYALGAISATGSFDTLFSQLISGFVAGFSIYISHLFGKGSFRQIKENVVSVTAFISIFALSVSLLTIIFRAPILDYLKVDPIIRTEAERYFVVYTAGYVIYHVNSVIIHVLHALGVTSFSLYTSILSAVLNIAGNLFTVLVLDMGVMGLALSTLLSAAVGTVIYVFMLYRAFKELPSEPASYRLRLSALTSSLRYTIPASVQLLAFHGITFLIAPSINVLGAAASTGYNVANRLYSFGTIGLWSTTNAFSCYIGQSVGEGSPAKIQKGLRCGFILNILTLAPSMLLICLLANPISSIFFPAGYTGEAFVYATRYAKIFLPFVYVQLIGHVLHAYMRSLGRFSVVLGVTIVGSLTRLACTFWLVPLLGMDGVFIGQIFGWGIDAAVSVLLCVLLYRTNKQLIKVIELAHEKKRASHTTKTS